VSHDKRAIVWDASDGSIIRIFENIHTAPILDVDWKDEDIFATCSTDANISICSLSCKEVDVIHVFEGHKDEINAICWSPSGQYLASCSDDNTAKVWVILDEGEDYNGQGVRESGTITVKPEAKVVDSSTPVVTRTHRRGGYLLYDLCGHAKEIYTTRWTPTGPGSINPDKELCLCTASFDGNVKVWRMTDGAVLYNLCNNVKTIPQLLSPNPKKDDEDLTLTGNEPQPVYSVSSSPNGEYLAIGSQGGYVSIWDMSNGTLVSHSVIYIHGLDATCVHMCICMHIYTFVYLYSYIYIHLISYIFISYIYI